MSPTLQKSGSLRRRLLLQLLLAAALLSTFMYLSVRAVAEKAAEATHNNILGASATSIVEQLRSSNGEIVVDIPYSAFSMLGSISDDQVFYRIESDRETLTGYEDLPLPDATLEIDDPHYYTARYKSVVIRATAVRRVIPIAGKPKSVIVAVAQTRFGQDAIASGVANTAALLGVGFFILTGLLSWIATNNTVKPIRTVAEKITRRGPQDLRPLDHPVPQELQTLVDSLNGFIGRLRGTLRRTETFIADAAHHVRTPLAIVRTRAEIALRHAEGDDARQMLRSVIRAVDESSRSATQLLEHATVSYRSDQVSHETFDVSLMLQDVMGVHEATAELKDLVIHADVVQAVSLSGDRVLIESAVHNLLDNAIKYSEPDQHIDVTLQTDGADCLISICDLGRGLAGKSQADLTQRFERGSNVTDVVGSGLGLTIVEEVAHLHQGSFEILPRTGGGTCTSLRLPLSR